MPIAVHNGGHSYHCSEAGSRGVEMWFRFATNVRVRVRVRGRVRVRIRVRVRVRLKVRVRVRARVRGRCFFLRESCFQGSNPVCFFVAPRCRYH